MNHIWVAAITRNLDYSLGYEHRHHIRQEVSAVAPQKRAEVSILVCIVLSCYSMCASGFLFTHSNTDLNLVVVLVDC